MERFFQKFDTFLKTIKNLKFRKEVKYERGIKFMYK